MPTPMDVAALDLEGPKDFVANHRRRGELGTPLCANAVVELHRRLGKGLDFEKSYAAIRTAAVERRFVSYEELADASGADCSKVRYLVGPHLWRLVEYSRLRGWRC